MFWRQAALRPIPSLLPEYFTWAAFLLTAFLFYWMILPFSVNIPVGEEFKGFGLEFILQWKNSPSIGEKMELLFQQYGDHRPIIFRIVVLIQWQIIGAINFKYLILFGNLLYLLFVPFLLRLTFPRDIRLYWLVPAFLFLVVPMFRISDWSETAVGMPLSYFFITLVFYFLRQSTLSHLLLSLVFLIFSALSNSGVLFVFLTGVVLIFIQQNRPLWQKLLWTGSGLLLMSGYFSTFEFTRVDESPFVYFFENPGYIVSFFFLYLSSIFRGVFTSHYYLGVIAGIASVVCVGWMILRSWTTLRNNPTILGLILYTLFIGFATALTRSKLGIEQAIAPRYQVIIGIYWAVLYTLFIKVNHHAVKKYFTFIFIFSLCLSVLRWDDNLQSMRERKKWKEKGFYRALQDIHPFVLDHPHTKEEEKDALMDIIEQATRRGLYVPPAPPESVRTALVDPMLGKESRHEASPLGIIDNFEQLRGHAYVSGWGVLKGMNTGAMEKYVYLVSKKDTFYFQASKVFRKDVNFHFQDPHNYDWAGFEIFLPLSEIDIPPDNYQLGILLKKGNYWGRIDFPGKIIELNNFAETE